MNYKVTDRNTDLIIETFTNLKKAIKASDAMNAKSLRTQVVNSNGIIEW